jgi:hypothetical protein
VDTTDGATADDDRDDLAGDLATVTDEEWRTAHERLFVDTLADCGGPDEVDEVDRQFAYVWAPGQSTGAVEGDDIAPAAGEWDGRLRDGEQG